MYNSDNYVYIAVNPFIVSQLGALGAAVVPAREAFRSRPFKNSAGPATPALKQALVNRFEEVGAKVPEKGIVLNGSTPSSLEEAFHTIRKDPGMMGSHRAYYPKGPDGKADKSGPSLASEIKYNTYGDSAVLAHEMGHAVGQRTKVGAIINSLRSDPKLQTAIAASLGLIPAGVAYTTPGDDEYNVAALGALALSSPKIIDEALATKNALAIMDNAGIRASLGQRGKLAGGLLSYMAAPIAAAHLGTAVGNVFDEDIPPV